MPKRNAFYAQSGGVTAVINASACGVIETARRHRNVIGKVYAGANGIIGALREELIDTSKESARAIAGLRSTPSGAFGSCRHKLQSFDKDPREYQRLIDVFRAHDIGYFFYNGGGDSQDTANKVAQFSSKLGYPITCIGVPKTVDNDLPFTDTCPGFGSVAKYVAVSIREAALDVASMCETSTKVFIMEVMGRHAGWIAAAAGLAQETPDGPPHLIVFPEIAFDAATFVKKVDETVRRAGYCVIVVSEGARRADGTFLAEAGTKDAFGHAQLGGVAPTVAELVRSELGYKFHWAVADYLQRAAAPHRVGHRRRAGLRGGSRRGGIRGGRQERGDADHRAQVVEAVSLDDRRSAAFEGGQRREEDAAQLHHARRFRHHGDSARVSGSR